MPRNLGYVMTDRGRVRKMAPGPRIRGETQIIPTNSAWFKCRIDPKKGTQGRNPGEGRSVQEADHEFICLLTDTEGGQVEIQEQDEIEIERGVNGTFTYYGVFEVTAAVRKPRDLREDILIYVPSIKRLEEV